MSYGKASYVFYDDDFDTIYDEKYYENYSCFREPKKLNCYKTYYLSHNTLTFLLTNRESIDYIVKKDKRILSYLFNRDY